MSRPALAPARSRRTRLPPEVRREHLLDVAGEILLSSGFEALTMEGVALRAGVSKGLGYAYFHNAEDLALALYQREVEAVYRRVKDAMTGTVSFDDGVRVAIRAYLDLVAERGALFALLETRLSRGRRKRGAREPLGGFLGFWAAQLTAQRGVAPGRARVLAAVVLSTADLFARSWLAGRLSRAEAERLCANFVVAGLHGALSTPGARRAPRGSHS